MKIFREVTLKYLKKNKVRTFVAIVGILLSSAMVCAVTTFLVSMDQYVIENAIYNTGDWHAGLVETDWQMCETLVEKEEISNIVYNQRMGYARIEEVENEYKSYYYLLGVKQDFLDTMCVNITSGRFPSEQFEILLPESLSENCGVKYEIGDQVTLETGNRIYKSEILGQDDPYIFADENDREMFSREKTRVYTVVGFYDNLNYRIESASAPGYTIFVYFEEKAMLRDYYVYDVYFKMKDMGNLYQFVEENELSVAYNTEVLGVIGMLQQNGSSSTTIVFVIFLMGLILVGAVALIYNMFSISVSERTKQFGLLSSIGATQKQIRGMVLYESFLLSIVGIPLGIGVGIGGIWTALQFIGDKFEALGYSIPMPVHISFASVMGSILISLVTVLISVWIPSKRAMQINIIETIKQNNDIYQSEKKEKTYNLINKIFGISGVLAGQYCNRSKKKYKATLLSLCISCILLL